MLENQDEIGSSFKPYYGEEVSKKITVLLKEHITISVDVVKAAKAEDVLALDEANKRWYANSSKISELLNKQNSYWPLADLITMMNWHLKLTTEEATHRIKKDYDADVLAFDKVRMQLMTMSDMLCSGIVKQFPARFKTMKGPIK